MQNNVDATTALATIREYLVSGSDGFDTDDLEVVDCLSAKVLAVNSTTIPQGTLPFPVRYRAITCMRLHPVLVQ